MNTQSTVHTTIFQDRDLLNLTPATNAASNSWQRLTAGDERAERFENLLRMGLVVSLFCAMVISALHLQPATDDLSDNVRLACPTMHMPQLIRAPAAAVQAASQAF